MNWMYFYMTKSRNLYSPRNATKLSGCCGGVYYAKGLCKKHYMMVWEESNIDLRQAYHRTEKFKEQQKGYRQSLRSEVIKEYGGKCSCLGCPEELQEFLTIDHIGGSGASQRRLGQKKGWQFYKWLKDNGYPKDNFQLLCMNCNWAKYSYGGCPHQT